MGWVFDRPWLTVVEVAWRWLFGAGFLVGCWFEAQKILAKLPLESTGLTTIDPENPWVAVEQLGNAWALYEPHLLAALHRLLPLAALVWVVSSGLGRSFLFRLLEPRLRFRPIAAITLQAAWLGLFLAVCWGWFRSIQWVSSVTITAGGEPDLVGYSVGVIFLSLGFFTAWAVVSWPLSIAPLLMLLEDRSPLSALGESFRLGKAFTSKLIEINLVMGIVKLALMVLAMVLSAAPLPFNDQLGPGALHGIWALATVFYFVAGDYFQVVRLKGFVEFWKMFRSDS
jgi:hypothetical protein